MSKVLNFFPNGYPLALVFSAANPLKSAVTALTLPQGNGFVVPEGYNLHPLLLSVKTTAAVLEKIANGGFETAGEGDPDFFASWTESAGNGAIAVEAGAGNFYAGEKSAKLTTGADGAVSLAQAFAVIEGYSYRLSFRVKGDGVVNKARYSIVDSTASEDIVATKAVPTASAAFYQVTEAFVAPADCEEVTITLMGSATEGAIAYFDEVSVVITAIPEPTATFAVAADGVALTDPICYMDDLQRSDEDGAHVDWPPIAEGKVVTVVMGTTANYTPETADVDAVLLAVLKPVS